METEITFVNTDIQQAYEAGELIALGHSIHSQMVGKAWEFAEVLYWLSKSIVLPEEEKFDTWAATEYGVSETTVSRYVKVWNLILNAPEQTSVSMLDKAINTMIPLGVNIANGKIGLEEVPWEEVEKSQSNGDIRELVRKITGREERKGTVNFTITAGGDVIAYRGDERAFVGFLEPNPESELAKMAVERIKHYLKGQ